MTELTVEPPEYYPVVEKFFVDGVREALETLGVELLSVKAGVKQVGKEIRLAFIFEVGEEAGFIPVDLNAVISEVLDKLTANANAKFGKFQNVRFRVMGFRMVEGETRRREESGRLVIDCPDDLRRTLERLGKGLMIYLQERELPFTSLTLTVPHDGKPRLVVALLLERETSPYEKASLERTLEEKTLSYLRALNADYLSVEVRVLDPGDEKVAKIVRERERIEKQAEEVVKDEDIRELMKALGKWPHGN